MNKNILAFDTSMGPCSVALLRDGVLVANAVLMDSHQQVKRLMPMIETAMQQAGLTYPDLDVIAVGIGPGSFTGIRIGMAAAHGFALSGNIPLMGITTLQAMVFESLHDHTAVPTSPKGCIGAVMHAGKGQYYCQWFASNAQSPVGDATLCSLQEAAIQAPSGQLCLVGNAAAELAALLPNAHITDIMFPRAEHIARLAALSQSHTHHLEPLYIRPPDAKLPQPR